MTDESDVEPDLCHRPEELIVANAQVRLIRFSDLRKSVAGGG